MAFPTAYCSGVSPGLPVPKPLLLCEQDHNPWEVNEVADGEGGACGQGQGGCGSSHLRDDRMSWGLGQNTRRGPVWLLDDVTTGPA